MKRMALTFLTTVFISLVGLGTAWAHPNGNGRRARSGIRQPQVCSTAQFHHRRVIELEARAEHLNQRYRYEMHRYGWRAARGTYYQLQRVQSRLRDQRAQERRFAMACHAAQRGNRRYGRSGRYARND